MQPMSKLSLDITTATAKLNGLSFIQEVSDICHQGEKLPMPLCSDVTCPQQLKIITGK
jgi:hypothetical protein